MDQIDDQEDIASDEEVNNVDAEPIECDSDNDDLDLITLVLDDPNSVRCKKHRYLYYHNVLKMWLKIVSVEANNVIILVKIYLKIL